MTGAKEVQSKLMRGTEGAFTDEASGRVGDGMVQQGGDRVGMNARRQRWKVLSDKAVNAPGGGEKWREGVEGVYGSVRGIVVESDV